MMRFFTMAFLNLFRAALFRFSFQLFLNLAFSFLTTAHKNSPPLLSWLLFRFHILRV